MKRIEPFTDDKLEWDGSQYVLTRAYIKQNFDIAYRDDGILDRRRRKNSIVVYGVIQSRIALQNAKFAKIALNYTEEGRKFILDILTEQMEADLQGGYNDLGSTSAINVANGQVIPRQEIERNLLCVTAELMLDRITNYFPFNIFMQFEYPFGIKQALIQLRG